MAALPTMGVCPILWTRWRGIKKLEHRTELQATMWGWYDCRLPSGVENMLNLKRGTAAMTNLKEPSRQPWRQRRQGALAWLGLVRLLLSTQ